jgi:uncharacterized protein involved in high-affinity Fe2+ transport
MQEKRYGIWAIATVSMIFLLTGIPFTESAVADEGKNIEIGKVIAGGMEIKAELEAPSAHQMPMMDKWMVMKPEKNVTHHLEVKTSVPGKGYRIPYSEVKATFLNLQSKKTFTKKAHPMFGGNFHYGVDVTLTKGKYEITIDVSPPTLMRMEESLNKWLKPVKTKFQFEVK